MVQRYKKYIVFPNILAKIYNIYINFNFRSTIQYIYLHKLRKQAKNNIYI